MKKDKYILTGILIATAVSHIYGIGWGVPGKERIDLIFEKKEHLEELSPVMQELHEEIEIVLPVYGRPYHPSFNPEEAMTVRIENQEILTRKSILNALRSYLIRSYGVDEHRVFVALKRINPGRLEFNPRFYEYGGVYMYPLAVFIKIADSFNLVTLKSDISFYFFHPDELGKLFVSARLFGAFGMILATCVFYLTGLNFFKKRVVTLWLTLLFGICPAMVIWSHHLKPFSYGILWVVLTLWALSKYLIKPSGKWIVLAGIFSGLAFGTLFTYGYIYWAVILSIMFISRESFYRKFRWLIMSFCAFLLAFFITNPYVLISWQDFIQELRFLKNFWPFESSFSNLAWYFFTSMRYGMGTVLWFFIFSGVFAALLFKPREKDWMLFLMILPGFLYVSFTTPQWIHYGLFFYPPLFLLAGRFFDKADWKKGSAVIFSAVSLYTVLYISAYLSLFAGDNIRTVAGRWINSNIEQGAAIGMQAPPCPWCTPPFHFLRYDIRLVPDAKSLEHQNPLYFLASQEQWGRGGSLEELESFLAGYEKIKYFKRRFLWPIFAFNGKKKIPYDLCHPCPEIVVFKRKGSK